jgi:HPt (histidine-containing phosphotransfer) domain-containing protein
MNDKAAKIAALEQEIEQLKRQWPAHSVSPTLLQRLEELEEALAEAQDEPDAEK